MPNKNVSSIEVDKLMHTIESYIGRAFDEAEQSSVFASSYSAQFYEYDPFETFLAEEENLEKNFVPIVNLFMNVARWFPANPSKPKIVEKLNAVYFKSGDFGTGRTPKFANQIDEAGGYTLGTEIVKNSRIVVTGERGIGKTTFLNFWLNNETKEFLEDKNKLLWFRIDAQKLYEIWLLEARAHTKLTSMADYFFVHAIYIVVTYSKKGNSTGIEHTANPIFEKFGNQLKAANGECSKLWRQFVKIVEDFQTQFASAKDVSVEVIKRILRNDTQVILARSLYGFFKSVISNEYGILAIVDGIDNVPWRRSNKNYFTMLNELGLFQDELFFPKKSDPNAIKNNKLVIVVRPETVPDLIDGGNVHYHGDANLPSFVELALGKQAFASILSTKENAFSLRSEFGSERASASAQCVDEYNRHLSTDFRKHMASMSNFAATYCDALCKELARIISHVDNPLYNHWHTRRQWMLETLFNGNCRAFIDNFIAISQTRNAAKKVNIPKSTAANRLPQYMLLNGRLHIVTEKASDGGQKLDDIRRGEFFPNLFWYDVDLCRDATVNWYGLVTTRILQLTAHHQITAEEVVSLLQILFRYPEKCIRERIEKLVAFGLLNVKFIPQAQNRFAPQSTVETQHQQSGWNIELSATDRGRMIYDLSYSYPDWLYFMALDTPLPTKFSESTNHIRVHRDPKSKQFITNFKIAFCVTIPFFVRTIKQQFLFETENLNRALKTQEANAVTADLARLLENHLGNLSNLYSIFSLPAALEKNSLSSVGILLDQLQRRHSDRFAELKTDLEGAFER